MTTPAARIAEAGLRQAWADGAQALVIAATCGPDGTESSARATLQGVRISITGQACGHAVKMAARAAHGFAAALPTESARETFWTHVVVAALGGAYPNAITAAGRALTLHRLLRTIGATTDEGDVHRHLIVRRVDPAKGDSP